MKIFFEGIVTAGSLEEVLDVFGGLRSGDALFVDVDDVLITPISKLFYRRGNSAHFIDTLKEKKGAAPHLEEIIGRWRLSRIVQLVHPAWPEILQTLSKRDGIFVFALTQMDTGAYGPIPSMEEWRFGELKKHGLVLTGKIANQDVFRLGEDSDGKYACFYKGVLMTSTFSKGAVLRAFLIYTKWRPSRIVFIDDLYHHLEDVQKVAGEFEIPFLGIHLKEIEKVHEIPDTRVAALQEELLINQREWVEDQEAEKRLLKIKD